MQSVFSGRPVPVLAITLALAGLVGCIVAGLRWGATGAILGFGAIWIAELVLFVVAYAIHRTRETPADIATAHLVRGKESSPITSAGVGELGRPTTGSSEHRVVENE